MQTQHHTNRPVPAPLRAFDETRLACLGGLAVATAAVAAVLSACGGSSSIGTSTGGGGGGGGSTSTNYVVTTVAGKGEGNYGSTDGPASVATFYHPTGVALGSNGSLYVADSGNYKIRMIAANGTVSTVAGTGTQPSYGLCSASNLIIGDGPCASAQFGSMSDVAVDSNGNLYVSDYSTIRKITNPGTASCTVSTLAGSSCSSGNADGTGVNARFGFNVGQLKLDTDGNIYVADFANDSIRRVTPAGVVTTVAGNLGGPAGLAIDRIGNLYVGGLIPNVRKITPEGVVSILAGSATGGLGGTDGTGTNASFDYVYGMIFGADGMLYVSDTGNCLVRQITAGGQVTTLAGIGCGGFVDGPARQARIYAPMGLAMDASSGAIYVADEGNHAIRKIAPQ